MYTTRECYEPGGWYRLCDRCGRKRRHYDTRKEWTGLIVCTDGCFEERNQQDYVRGVADRQRVPDPRPEPADVFLSANEVTADDL
jgi:hypothetical protein